MTQAELQKLNLGEGFYCVASYLGCEQPVQSTKNPGQVYYNVNLLVGTETQRFEVDAVTYGEAKTMKRLQPVFVSFDEFKFQNGGSKKTIKTFQQVQ